MTEEIQLDHRTLLEALRSDEAKRFFAAIGREVRDRARSTARTVVPQSSKAADTGPIRDSTGRFKARAADPADAIVSLSGEDDEGIYVDVGYSRNHPGFYLWWWEVGTVNHAARPHLRPALRPHG